MSTTHACIRAEDLLAALQPHAERWRPDPRAWVFRGQANADWPLLPSAFRATACIDLEPGPTGPKATHRAQVHAERVLLGKFRQLADAQGLHVPGPHLHLEGLLSETRPSPDALACEEGRVRWIPEEAFAVAAIAQHYGVPTRLVDWTRRPFVAAWFAAVEAAAWALDARPRPAHATHLAVWALRRRHAEERLHDVSCVYALTAPRSDNPNLHAQSGLFTLAHGPAAPDGPPDLRPLDTILAHTRLGGTPVLHRWTLPLSEAPRLLRMLADDFVHGGVIYSGFAGVAAAIREYPLRRR